jgi:signal transduction histidine kinase/ActR/RegA family two-component response regulator
VATALAYAAVGLVALRLAIPPGYAAPLYPSAGIALAAVLVFGRRAVPGVALGALLVNLTLGTQRGEVAWGGAGVAAMIAIGAALQSLAGATLIERFVRQPLTLGEPRDVALFFGLGGALACVVNATLATATLIYSGAVPLNDLLTTWLTWWSGDTLGVLIAAPIVLTLIGRPRTEWAPRRLTVGLSLSLATAFMAAGIAQVVRWDEERARNAFERDADNAGSALSAQLQEPLHALEALRGVFIASDDVTQHEMQRATRRWLEAGNLAAMGWSERVPSARVAAFEARVRAEGLPNYRVFDRADVNPRVGGPTPADEVVAIRFIEPMQGNAAALGVNALSIPAARAAMEAASRSGLPVATAGFRLTQQRAEEDETGVVIYSALYEGEPASDADRQRAWRGVVFVSLRVDLLLKRMLPGVPADLSLCVVDTDPMAPRRRIAGRPGCDAERSAAQRVRPLAFAGRQWELRIDSAVSEVARTGSANAWLFALVGLAAAAMLGALLLTVTGRTRRIEEAVRTRTEALQAETRDREQAQLALRAAENARELAEASNLAKSDFLSRMSHELRTPLNAILGFAQLLDLDRRHPLAPEQQPWVSQIQKAGWHLLEMINDVLDLSRIESGNLRLQPEPLSLAELITGVVPMVKGDAGERGISIVTELADSTGTVLGDATRVRQILLNLLSNAVKYNVDGGFIHVTSRMRGSDVAEILVTDTGIGMSAEQHADLFKPFNRLGQEQSTRQGTGIGLVISRSLAELMGGALHAHPAPGRGTVFTLSLPVGTLPAGAPADAPRSENPPGHYAERVVHYIEDNETNVEVMRGILAQRPQLRMGVSINGAEGLAAVRSRLPDLVLLDMHLPDMTGLDLLRRLKADPATAGIPVVAVSADAVPRNVDAALEAGAVRYLTKPVNVAELLAAVDAQFSQLQPA